MDKECLGASFIRVLNTIYHNLGGMCNRFKCMGAYSHAGVCGYTVCKQKKKKVTPVGRLRTNKYANYNSHSIMVLCSLFKCSGEFQDLDFVESSYIHGLYKIFKSCYFLFQYVCSDFVIFNNALNL